MNNHTKIGNEWIILKNAVVSSTEMTRQPFRRLDNWISTEDSNSDCICCLFIQTRWWYTFLFFTFTFTLVPLSHGLLNFVSKWSSSYLIYLLNNTIWKSFLFILCCPNTAKNKPWSEKIFSSGLSHSSLCMLISYSHVANLIPGDSLIGWNILPREYSWVHRFPFVACRLEQQVLLLIIIAQVFSLSIRNF